jgi:hypothetical protein
MSIVQAQRCLRVERPAAIDGVQEAESRMSQYVTNVPSLYIFTINGQILIFSQSRFHVSIHPFSIHWP